MCARISRRLLHAVTKRFVEQLPSFVGHTGRTLNGAAEAVELPREVVESGLDLAPELSAAIRKEEIARYTA
jgi:hypothetical protein